MTLAFASEAGGLSATMTARGVKESQVGASRVRYAPRQNVLVVELVDGIAVADLPALTRSITQNIRLAHTARTVLDIRSARDRDRAFRDAFTEWAVSGDLPLVLVVGDELHVAEINMASLARGGLVRAFSTTSDAFRHAARQTTKQNESTSVSESARPAIGSDERRSLLFPRRPSEVSVPRIARGAEPDDKR